MRHVFTTEERRKGGKAGFRVAVASVQERYALDFNEAVQWLMRKISPGGDWQKARLEIKLKGGAVK
jgi:hypothetical protein